MSPQPIPQMPAARLAQPVSTADLSAAVDSHRPSRGAVPASACECDATPARPTQPSDAKSADPAAPACPECDPSCIHPVAEASALFARRPARAVAWQSRRRRPPRPAPTPGRRRRSPIPSHPCRSREGAGRRYPGPATLAPQSLVPKNSPAAASRHTGGRRNPVFGSHRPCPKPRPGQPPGHLNAPPHAKSFLEKTLIRANPRFGTRRRRRDVAFAPQAARPTPPLF